MQQLCALSFNFASAVMITVINKICFSHVHFEYPTVLSLIHYVMTWTALEIMRRCGWFVSVSPAPQLTDHSYLITLIAVGAAPALNNTALKLNSIGFYQLFKLLLTPGVVLLEYWL